MDIVQCMCSECKTADTIQEMGSADYSRFNKVYQMFDRLNWLYGKKSNLGGYVKYVYGEDNNKLFTRVWNKAKSDVTLELGANKVIYSVFNELVKSRALAGMKQLNELRNEYEELREEYNKAKYYNTSYDTEQVIDESGDTSLQCKCGNNEIFVISPHAHSKHLGISSEDIQAEFGYDDSTGTGIYSDDDYNYDQDTQLNMDIKQERLVIHAMSQEVEAHKAEALFWNLVQSSLTIGQVHKKLGKKAYLITDVISDYYVAKGIK